MGLSPRRLLWAVTALVLAAFVLRVANLERRPLHFDEGINVTFGQQSPAQILNLSRSTFDNDPPGHRMALGIWMALAGTSPFSIRIFSVGFSVLVIASLYRLLRNMRLTAIPALVAAVLVTISPYAIDYGQQAKGYAMGAGLAAISWLMWVNLFATGRGTGKSVWWRVAVYVASTALALSTHYYALFLLPMQWLWFAGTHLDFVRGLFRRRTTKQSLVPFVKGGIVQVLAMLPIGVWLALMAASLQVSTARSSTKFTPASPFDLLGDIFGEMSAGQFAMPALQLIGGVVVLALALIGALRLWRSADKDRRHTVFWFGLAVLVPVTGAVVLQQRVTFFFPRFLQYALPNLVVLVAGCALPFAHLARRFATAWLAAPVAVATGVMAAGTATFYAAPIDSADDYRPLIEQMRPYIRQGDAALGTYIWMEGLFDSYAPESNNVLTWYYETYSPDTVDALLAPIARGYARIWSLNYYRDPDAPNTLSVLWLKRNEAIVDRFSAGATTALLFDNRTTMSAAQAVTVTFGDIVQLVYTPVTAQVTYGDSLPVVLNWTALRQVDEHAYIYFHLIAPNGELAAQNDGDAVNGLAPSYTWIAGKTVTERRAIPIPPISPGEYKLVVGLYRESNGARLITATGADSAQVGTITVR